ncbi:MAG: hypothetical protein ACJ71Q_09260 [Terriglobales bacterium]
MAWLCTIAGTPSKICGLESQDKGRNEFGSANNLLAEADEIHKSRALRGLR